MFDADPVEPKPARGALCCIQALHVNKFCVLYGRDYYLCDPHAPLNYEYFGAEIYKNYL